MPKKKQQPTQTASPSETVVTIVRGDGIDEQEASDAGQVLSQYQSEQKGQSPFDACGHVNKHWRGTNPLVMKCVLPPGHAGNHLAPYQRADGTIEDGAWNNGVDT